MPKNEFSDVFFELQKRGSLENISFDLDTHRNVYNPLKTDISCYIGFDPTAKSLHIGNLVPLIQLLRMQRYGFRPVAIVGDGTGLVGDPSGKDRTRPVLQKTEASDNADRIEKQIRTFFENNEQDTGVKKRDLVVKRNSVWLKKLDLIGFLRDVGNKVSVNRMLRREAIKTRLNRDEHGMSYAEFSYQIIQAYDFYYLAVLQYLQKENSLLGDEIWFQAGGSDQWGNMVAGLELISKAQNKKDKPTATPQIISYPLVTNTDGTKFGKSENNAPTIDKETTSAYALYQFFFNVADVDVVRYLKLFTLLEISYIENELAHEVSSAPGKRRAQKTLACEVTRMVHGDTGLSSAIIITDALFSKEYDKLSKEQIKDAFYSIDAIKISPSVLGNTSLAGLINLADKSYSKGKARTLISGNAVSVNGKKITDPNHLVKKEDTLKGTGYIFLNIGKKRPLLLLAAV